MKMGSAVYNPKIASEWEGIMVKLLEEVACDWLLICGGGGSKPLHSFYDQVAPSIGGRVAEFDAIQLRF